MNNKKFDSPLKLKINDHSYEFSSVSDFAFNLEGRTAISVKKLSDLFKLPIDELESQASKISEVKKKLLTTVSNMLEDTDSNISEINKLEPTLFTQDHNWREIIQALSACDSKFISLRTTALTKYIQYLTSLDETIGYIKKEKESVSKSNNQASNSPEFNETWGPGDLPLESPPGTESNKDLKKLPKDKVVKLKLPPGEQMDVRLASYNFQVIASGNTLQYVDKDRTIPLINGRHIVGRSSNSSIKIDPTIKDVSRTHLIIQISDGNVIHFTDTSSAGSYIPIKYLDT